MYRSRHRFSTKLGSPFAFRFYLKPATLPTTAQPHTTTNPQTQKAWPGGMRARNLKPPPPFGRVAQACRAKTQILANSELKLLRTFRWAYSKN